MTIEVEDGTGKTDSNSYISLAEARVYASARGVTLSSDDATLEPLLIKAMDYIEALALRFVGTPTNATQALQWPRADVVFGEDDYPDSGIPTSLKTAQCRLVLEQARGVDIMPTVTGAFVKREKVGPIETEYSEAVNVTGQPSMPLVDSMLAPLLTNSGGFALTTLRV